MSRPHPRSLNNVARAGLESGRLDYRERRAPVYREEDLGELLADLDARGADSVLEERAYVRGYVNGYRIPPHADYTGRPADKVA